MNNDIICKECNGPNAPGSKFCNHCGTRLPPTTNLICPKCQTPNPKNRFYCDECGTRLVHDKLPTEAKSEPPEEPPSANVEIFSLPVREPGQTGILDSAALPDWLKTGEMRTLNDFEEGGEPVEPAEKADDEKKLPKLEELTPAKRTTDDLPDWLIDSDDEDPIIHAPTEITTEHYLDLIQEAEESPGEGDLPDDEIITSAADANLPDWLAEPGAEPPPAPPSTAETDISDWLAELSQPAAAKSTTDDDSTPDDFKADEESSDWLSELGPPNTDILAHPSDPDTGQLTQSPFAQEETPDWMAELGPPNTDILSQPTPKPPPPEPMEPPQPKESHSPFPDWLAGVTEEDDAGASPGFEPVEPAEAEIGDLADDFADSPELEEGAEKPFSDWLADITPDDEVTAPEYDDSREERPQKQVSDWLAELSPDEEAAEAISPEPILSDDAAPDLFDEFAGPPQPEESADAPLSDWLADITAAAESAVLPSPEPADFDDALFVDAESDEAEPVAQVDEFAELSQLEEEPDDALPDWLASIASETDTLVAAGDERAKTELDDLFGTGELAEEMPLDWLLETGELKPETAGMEGEPEAIPDDQPDAPLAEADQLLAEEPDWLGELAAFDTDGLMATDESETAVEPIVEEPEAARADEAEIPEVVLLAEETAEPTPETEPEEEVIDDWESEDPFVGKPIMEEEIPDWLQQLGPPVGSQPPADIVEDETLIPSEDIPEWVADLRPTPGQAASILPSAAQSTLLPETLDGIPEELAGADLPDWLQGVPSVPVGETAVSPTGEVDEIPDWLKSDAGLGETADTPAGTTSPATSSEWTAILSDLPPAVPPDHGLAEAEIPEWVQALKPRQLVPEEEREPVPVGPAQTSGPLAGLHNVIDVEPIIAMPRSVSPIPRFAVSKEQQQQAALLRRLSHEEKKEAVAVTPGISTAALIWSRIILAVLLVAAILMGLIGPDLLRVEPLSMPSSAQEARTAVDAAAGQTVLVAFEYTPAMAGELDRQAELLLAQLDANGSPIITVSQYAAGTAVAAARTETYAVQSLGLLPGEAIGLRQLAVCMARSDTCNTLLGRPVDAEMRQALEDISLIIVLTGERDNLVYWVEQVGATDDAPLLAGVTQSLGPVAAPYFASGQLQGVLEGFPATAAYEQASRTGETRENTWRKLNAQSMAQLLAAVLLLIGSLIYGIAGATSNQSNKRIRA